MRKVLTALVFMIMLFNVIKAQSEFEKFFEDKTMRIDYYHTGDSEREFVSIDRIYIYGIWAGSKLNLIDEFNNGAYYYKIYDANDGRLLYSKGFDSYFKEYQTTDDAASGILRTYHESAIIPAPKNKIKFVLEKRDRSNQLKEIFSTLIDPDDVTVIRKEFFDSQAKIIKSHIAKDPHECLDILILGDGYTKDEEEKFQKDLKRYTDLIMNFSPYNQFKDKINFTGIYRASEESGIDEPDAGQFKNNLLGTTFYSLGSERYVLTEDNKTMRDLAALVPYDAIYIMCNTERYGGGGIYNFYCTFTSDNQFSDYIFLHEFGHSFGGLADEYYTNSVAYNEFYPKDLEPVEPNITRLLDKENLKWKSLVTAGIELPTPWEKEEFDKMDLKWQKERAELNKKIAQLKKIKAPESEIKKLQEEYNRKDKEHSAEVDRYLRNSKYWNKVGAFEGAGYSSEGMYRPMLDCLMFSKGAKPFCRVCEEHIKKVIGFYTNGIVK
ncbi:M64 family metallopeptidase [Melioribacter sp. OK-6-Me]|uniref:M64 family metallopeptidase n=1 Tax=unclassified Melioribacter TaxID=2627329 RepID=UPI003ED84EFE